MAGKKRNPQPTGAQLKLIKEATRDILEFDGARIQGQHNADDRKKRLLRLLATPWDGPLPEVLADVDAYWSKDGSYWPTWNPEVERTMREKKAAARMPLVEFVANATRAACELELPPGLAIKLAVDARRFCCPPEVGGTLFSHHRALNLDYLLKAHGLSIPGDRRRDLLTKIYAGHAVGHSGTARSLYRKAQAQADIEIAVQNAYANVLDRREDAKRRIDQINEEEKYLPESEQARYEELESEREELKKLPPNPVYFEDALAIGQCVDRPVQNEENSNVIAAQIESVKSCFRDGIRLGVGRWRAGCILGDHTLFDAQVSRGDAETRLDSRAEPLTTKWMSEHRHRIWKSKKIEETLEEQRDILPAATEGDIKFLEDPADFIHPAQLPWEDYRYIPIVGIALADSAYLDVQGALSEALSEFDAAYATYPRVRTLSNTRRIVHKLAEYAEERGLVG